MASRKELMDMVQSFMVNRQLTFDLLKALGGGDLERVWPRPGLDTFCKHFGEMAAVERAFVDALRSGVMDFSSVPDVFSFPRDVSKTKLKEDLVSADEDLRSRVETVPLGQVVDWGDGVKLTVKQHLVNLVSHEVFHQGMMTMAIYIFNLAMPESWVTNWALPISQSPSEQN